MRLRVLSLIPALLLVAVSSALATPTMSLGIEPAMPTMEEPISASEWIVPEVDMQRSDNAPSIKAAIYRPYRLADQEPISAIPEPKALLLLGLALAGLAAGRQLME